MKTIVELKDERARVLDQVDDILATVKEANRSLTADERSTHDALVEEVVRFDADIATAETEAGDIARFEAQAARNAPVSPMINIRGDRGAGSDVTRNLDELLWATAESLPNANGTARVNIDQVVVRSDNDPAGVLAPRIEEFRGEDRQVIRQFQTTVADMCLFGLMLDKSAHSSRDGFEVARSHRAYKDKWTHIMRAMDTDTTAEGVEWVPTGMGASLHEKIRIEGKIAPLFARINLPTNPWKWPLEGADATAYRVAEPTSDTATKVTASTPGTAAATFDAEIFGARTLFSKSLEADSIIAVMNEVKRKIVMSFVSAEEKAILDGDTDGTHQDSDTNTAGTTSASWAWDGLRKRALAETTQAITTTTAANLALVRKKMAKWGVNPADLAFIVGIQSFYAMLADSSLLTIDKLGPNATILTGQLGAVHGVPVIVSEHVREDLNASGVVDGITATKTYALCVNRNEWAMGQRMALDVEVDDSIYRETYQRVLVGFMREDFQSIAAASTDETTSIGYNITSGS